MKKLISLFLLFTLSISLVACTKNSNAPVEKQVKNFEKDGTLTIEIFDEIYKVEEIQIDYNGEYLTRVRYIINEKDVDTLNMDKEELVKLEPAVIEVTEDETNENKIYVLDATYTSSDLAGDNISFEKFNKTNINDYINTLKDLFADYTFKFNYECK